LRHFFDGRRFLPHYFDRRLRLGYCFDFGDRRSRYRNVCGPRLRSIRCLTAGDNRLETGCFDFGDRRSRYRNVCGPRLRSIRCLTAGDNRLETGQPEVLCLKAGTLLQRGKVNRLCSRHLSG
jgi:hypothetical protein